MTNYLRYSLLVIGKIMSTTTITTAPKLEYVARKGKHFWVMETPSLPMLDWDLVGADHPEEACTILSREEVVPRLEEYCATHPGVGFYVEKTPGGVRAFYNQPLTLEEWRTLAAELGCDPLMSQLQEGWWTPRVSPKPGQTWTSEPWLFLGSVGSNSADYNKYCWTVLEKTEEVLKERKKEEEELRIAKVSAFHFCRPEAAESWCDSNHTISSYLPREKEEATAKIIGREGERATYAELRLETPSTGNGYGSVAIELDISAAETYCIGDSILYQDSKFLHLPRLGGGGGVDHVRLAQLYNKEVKYGKVNFIEVHFFRTRRIRAVYYKNTKADKTAAERIAKAHGVEAIQFPKRETGASELLALLETM